MKIKIVQISENYLKEAHEIYNYYIENSFSNFEDEKITFKQFKKTYKEITSQNLPYLAALYMNQVIGIAYLNKFREKNGYRFSFENTIYIHKNYISMGIGKKLLAAAQGLCVSVH